MTTALTVAAIAVGGLLVSFAIAVPVGKALHRAGHRQGLYDAADLAECPPWCVRERAAVVAAVAGRHRRSKR